MVVVHVLDRRILQRFHFPGGRKHLIGGQRFNAPETGNPVNA